MPILSGLVSFLNANFGEVMIFYNVLILACLVVLLWISLSVTRGKG